MLIVWSGKDLFRFCLELQKYYKICNCQREDKLFRNCLLRDCEFVCMFVLMGSQSTSFSYP